MALAKWQETVNGSFSLYKGKNKMSMSSNRVQNGQNPTKTKIKFTVYVFSSKICQTSKMKTKMR